MLCEGFYGGVVGGVGASPLLDPAVEARRSDMKLMTHQWDIGPL